MGRGGLPVKKGNMSDKIDHILKETGTLKEGHFLLTSGLHSPRYLEKFNILQYPWHTRFLCRKIAVAFRDKEVQLVAGPALGGVILAYEVAAQLKVKCIFAEREDGKRVFRRGFRIEPGTRVLIVDDIVTTGGSLDDMVNLIGSHRGIVAGIGVLLDRRSKPESKEEGFTLTLPLPLRERNEEEFPFYSCRNIPLPSYRPVECPLCRQGIPLVKPGSSL